MREWEIGAVENIHGALPYIRVATILTLVGVGVNRIGKERTIDEPLIQIIFTSIVVIVRRM